MLKFSKAFIIPTKKNVKKDKKIEYLKVLSIN